MSPSAPTVSCHTLRSAPALTASSAGAAAAGLPRGRGTFASGGGMAVARHLATVAGPFVPARFRPDPRCAPGLRRSCWLWPCPRPVLPVSGCVTVLRGSPLRLAPSRLTLRAGLAAPGCCSHPLRVSPAGLRRWIVRAWAGVATGSGPARLALVWPQVALDPGCPGGGLPHRLALPAGFRPIGLALRPGGEREACACLPPCSGLAFLPCLFLVSIPRG